MAKPLQKLYKWGQEGLDAPEKGSFLRIDVTSHTHQLNRKWSTIDARSKIDARSTIDAQSTIDAKPAHGQETNHTKAECHNLSIYEHERDAVSCE